jgi:orotate phosphoribosyltransferase
VTTADLVLTAQSILREKAVREFDEPIQLASGAMSRHFIDGKRGLAQASDLRAACEAIAALVHDAGIEWDAVGGLTLGADHLAVGLAMVTDRQWFFVRKEPKGRGTGQQIEGAVVDASSRVLLVEDITSTGSSMFKAYDIIAETGATIVAATTLIDRGDTATLECQRRGVPYMPLGTYRNFGMDPVVAG